MPPSILPQASSRPRLATIAETGVNPPERAQGLLRLANHPLMSGLAGFLTTAIMLLPIEYEAPLRSALLFVSMRAR